MARIRSVSPLAAFAVVLALALPAGAQSRSAVQIDNFGQVSATYYRGAQPKGHDYADLAELGIKTVINLTSDDAERDEQALVAQAGMKYVQIPMTTRQAPTPAQLDQFLRIVNDPASQPVYVHCVGGQHRTGVMTAAFRMTHDGWTSDRAFGEMKQYKFGMDMFHPEFKSFVYGYSPEAVRATKVADAVPAPTQAERVAGGAGTALASVRP